ncbi:adenosylcobinamide-phosphate synthase CbiB [Novosphingobium sp. ERW19]|uniref:adenosylcobinamide-phosphate synthase CbiB n=1 Tax=Novosphingobium sp. ERW19 TaxID=2726186 RepID=UPI001456A46D|nr:adenosylcobinamide-phosphate synthase CbiB [Novosphingobium sp. ERW19]NLR40518.1 cobalamin biosynthesis protein CobD [Novosphingobium sp. ERW19]
MAEPFVLTALIIDAAIGWPHWLYVRIGHPVGFFARAISACELRLNRNELPDSTRKAGGVLTVLLLLALAAGSGLLVTALCEKLATEWKWVLIAMLAWPGLAQRSLDQHFLPVLQSLQAGDLRGARKAAGMIVGRDTASLDVAGVARAAIESLAESFCDGVIAPLFWLIVAGLPGLWAMKAINTADSLIGHKEAPYRHFGWAAARLDDVMNFVPARLSAVLICLAGLSGWRITWRYCRHHASPNAGWPEAAMAGVLRVRLAGPVSYDGALADKPWIGEGGVADANSLMRARRVYHRACLLGWAIAGGMTWLH